MHITMLSARLPLTKTFVMDAGRLTAAPYPHVSKVTSHHAEVKDLAGFKDLLETHADKNHCLFNGHLDRPLQNESRAGHTRPGAREWVVFDFDKVPGTNAEDVIRTYLPKECHNVSYIAQLSSSMYRPDNTTWSGHLFMLLGKPIEQTRLKQWFEYLNFSVPALADAMTLSDSLEALRWPLDRTVAYDSKLIYIAPPRCVGFEADTKHHITLVKKKQPKLTIPAFNPIDTYTIRQKINELRRAVGEAEVGYELTTFEGHELLRNAQPSAIQGVKTSGDHYLRFNLNGGDSYAYFIDMRNPEIIKNFKGEPFMLTKQVDETLYKSLKRSAPSICTKPPLNDGTEVLAFYATNQSSAIKIGLHDPVDRRIELHSASETAARAWRAEYGLFQKEFLPHYHLEFNPQNDVQFMPGMTTINTFRTTDYMAQKKSTGAPSTLNDMPPLANKIIRSILGDPEDETVIQHFVNWLAYVFQFRKKTGTAWVLNGVEGSGKGTFIKHYLAPVFGPEHIAVVQYTQLRKEYNEFLERALFVVVEEADTKAADNVEEVMAKVFLWVTEEILPIRKMRTDVYDAKTYCNFIFNTNKQAPVLVSGTDRRFNFGERQTKRWYPTPNELNLMFQGVELEQFADTLQRWPVDEYAAAMVIDTQAKRDAHEATTTINQQIADAVTQGDLQFFIDRMPSDVEAAADFNGRFATIGLYKEKLATYAAMASTGTPMVVEDSDLFVLFRTLIPDPRFFQDSTTWRRRHYKSLGLDIGKQHRVPGAKDRPRGLLVEWQAPEHYAPPEPPAESTVTPIRRTRK
ncbi:MAG: DUF5906 domain-containing protein [Pseudomonadota bacterium]|nr:DUF5906 domain-containing protein [Pseudomonadota bacterium]